MKHNVKNVMLKFAWLFIAAMVAVTACKKDDPVDPVIPAEDGVYIKGDVTPFDDLELEGMFEPGINEVDQTPRTGMFEKFVTIKAGAAGFNIVTVAGQTQTIWGPATSEVYDPQGDDWQINIAIERGTLGTTGVFTVAEDGLYHVVIDIQTGKYAIAPVEFAIAGDPTAWGDGKMSLIGGFSMTSLKFSAEDLVFRSGQKFKFRYGKGWKFDLHEKEVKVNSNLGGVISGTVPNLTATTEPGGDDYIFDENNEGIYTITLEWSLADGFTAELLKTGDVPELGYPEELYMTGAAVGGWNWDPGVYVTMTKIADGKFEATTNFTKDEAFRFFAQADWGPTSFNYPYFDTVSDLFENAQDGDSNFKFVGETGEYKVTVDFSDKSVHMVAGK